MGKKVAIIGAGPGGLSAAYYLRSMGYSVTIYEAREKAGGMVRYGVPEYRMPYDQLDKDINTILATGVELKLHKKIGMDIDFDLIYNNFDAVFFSTGLEVPYKLEVLGEDLPGVIAGLQVLDRVN